MQFAILKPIRENGLFAWLINDENDKFFHLKTLFFIFLSFIILYYSIFSFSKHSVLILMPVALVVFLFSVFSVERLLYLTIFYTSVLPAHYYGITFMPVNVSFNITSLLFLVALFFGIIHILSEQNNKSQFKPIDYVLAMFLLMTVLSAFHGFLKGNNSYFLRIEFQFVIMYIAYFLFLFCVRTVKGIKYFYFVILLVSIIASFEFIFQSFIVNGFSFQRISTQQIHLAQIIIPLLVGFILYTKSWKYKMLCFGLLMPILFMTLISLTRALWVGVFVAIIFMIFQYRQKGQSKIESFFKMLMSIVSIGLIVVVLMFAMKGSRGSQVDASMGARVQTFGEMGSDLSLLIRYFEITNILDKTSENPIIGLGLGATILQNIASLGRFGEANYVDNAFIWIYWKMGLVGVFLYLMFLFLFFKRSLGSLKKLQDNDIRKLYLNSIVAGITGLCLISLTNSSLINYRFNIIWAIMFASAEIINRQVEESNEKLV